MDKRSIFGLEPDQLDELLSVVTGDLDKSELNKEKSDDANSSNKFQLPGPTISLHGSIEQPGSQIGRYKLLRILGEGLRTLSLSATITARCLCDLAKSVLVSRERTYSNA